MCSNGALSGVARPGQLAGGMLCGLSYMQVVLAQHPTATSCCCFVMVLDRWGARVCRGLPGMQLLADIAIPRW